MKGQESESTKTPTLSQLWTIPCTYNYVSNKADAKDTAFIFASIDGSYHVTADLVYTLSTTLEGCHHYSKLVKGS